MSRIKHNPVHELIAACARNFPEASRAEIAHALCIDEKTVGTAFEKAGISRPRTLVMRKRGAVVHQIEAFAEWVAGGPFEIEMIAGSGSRLKVNGVAA